MANCPDAFYCRSEYECAFGSVPYFGTGLAKCVGDNGCYGCGDTEDCDCDGIKCGAYDACGDALRICSNQCNIAYLTCEQRCLGGAACIAACKAALTSCANICGTASDTCADAADDDYDTCFAACVDATDLCETACGDNYDDCRTVCDDANTDCHITCSDALATCDAACAGDPDCEALCEADFATCEQACEDTWTACNVSCDDSLSDCNDACPQNACEDYTSDERARDCFQAKAECELNGCDRSLTTCYKDATATRIDDLFDANQTCRDCKDTANEAYQPCIDGCASDPVCECDCEETKQRALILCEVDSFEADYQASIFECQVTEARRTLPDDGIDVRTQPTCRAPMLDCESDCYADRATAYATAHDAFLTCQQLCYDGCDVDFLCQTQCQDELAVDLATADNTFDECQKTCCQTWEKIPGELASQNGYEDGYMDCINTRRTCATNCDLDYVNCQVACDSDPTCLSACFAVYFARDACISACAGDPVCIATCNAETENCIEACDSDRDDCIDALPPNRLCVDCSKPLGDAYSNPYTAKEFDFTPVIERCSC